MLPIKAIKLRAGFLLLLFTLMLISSNSFVTEIQAGESLEESFKSTPLPFWEIDNQNVLTQYGTYTQDVLFNYGEYLEDFSTVKDWNLFTGEKFSTDRGILSFEIKGGRSPSLRQACSVLGFSRCLLPGWCSFWNRKLKWS